MSHQLISTIFVLEFQTKGWPDLLQELASNTTHEDAHLQRSAFITLGYICEKLSSSHLELSSAEVENIIKGISRGVVEEQNNKEIKLTAIKSLQDALPLIAWKLADQEIRDFVLNSILKGTSNQSQEISLKSVQCLLDLFKACYPHLSARYMDVITDRTLLLIRSRTASIVIAATEFWNAVALHEVKLTERRQFDVKVICHGFANTYARPVTQALLQNLLEKEKEDIESGLSIHAATFACLSHIDAVGFGNTRDLNIEFISGAISKPEETFKVAGLLCFEAMISGCTVNISELVTLSYEAILGFLKVSPTLCRASLKVMREISCKYPEILLEDKVCVEWLEMLVKLIQSNYDLGIIVCSILSNLGESLYMLGKTTGYLVSKLEDIIKVLIESCFLKETATQLPFISSCFGAILNLVKAVKTIPRLNDILDTVNQALGSCQRVTGEQKIAIKEGLLVTALAAFYTLRRCKVERRQLNDSTLSSIYQLCCAECITRSSVMSDALHSLISIACRSRG